MKTLLETEKEKFRLEIPVIEKKYNIKVLLAYVRGSQMYGTATEESDVDISFVYQQPTDEILKGNVREDIDYDGKSNVVGYEIIKYIRLLGLNNPNILESLDIPEDCLIFQDESMVNVFKQEDWLSKLSEKSILGYADSQIKKATGLNKNMNKKEMVEKSILEFSFICSGTELVPFLKWYEDYKKNNEISLPPEALDYNNWGLTKIDMGKGFYNLITNYPSDNFRGLIKDDTSTQLRVSEVPKDLENREKFILYYNLDGFESYCSELKKYKQWRKERNEDRHNTNVAHGKNYDCYLDSETEYLTKLGWKKYDEISDDSLLGSINDDNELIYLPIIDRTKTKYVGEIYKYEDRYSKFSVTPNHRIYHSKVNRKKQNGWKLESDNVFRFSTVDEYMETPGFSKYVSHLNNKKIGISDIPDEWFFILGAYIGDGTVYFRNGEVCELSISQNINSRLFSELEQTQSIKRFSKKTLLGENYTFNYNNKDLIKWVVENVGYHSNGKFFNYSYFNDMSEEQFSFFYKGLVNSDGTTNKKSEFMTYYSISKTLIDDMQMFFFNRGIYCQIYEYPTKGSGFKSTTEINYHLCVPKKYKKEYRSLYKKSFKKVLVDDFISCFTVSSGLIITRNKNKISVQGNSKNMMHMFRILEIAENVAIHKRIIVRSENVEKLRVIRSGKEDYDELMTRAEVIFDKIKNLFKESDLRKTPDIEKGKEILLNFRKNWTYTTVEKVCSDCRSNEIVIHDCVCTYQNGYPTEETEITRCGCCDREQ